ncbi:MAG: thrombospondin type 3 repeat-containing protein [Deltaproteobacteria bacterium]|nr:thrombospondin type 3 repeat-containing protein [Deltaproteobacteria bacterium]
MNQKVLLGLLIGGSLMVASAAWAAEGECASGFCGTPRDVGGAGGAPCTEGNCAGGGGSILINNTDMGETYSTSDDFDNDGFEDDFDNCPFVANRDQLDADGDQIGSSCDNAPVVPNPSQDDVDGDGIGDVDDLDKDGDGLRNEVDNCPGMFNPVQYRTLDEATLGDACNSDDDSDGIADVSDPCPKVAGIANGADCDGDEDLDGILDASDNCPAVANANLEDGDGDALGDACDADMDGDGVPNTRDNAPDVANADQVDLDRDGVGDADDPELCYVFDRSKPGDCLNPLDTFRVRALAVRTGLGVGEQVGFVLLANRVDAAMSYSLRVRERPEGSENAVNAAVGRVLDSRDGFAETDGGFEYRFAAGRPMLIPDAPGEWQIEIVAELDGADAVFPEASRVATYSMAISVTGESTQASGCSANSARVELVGLAMLGLLVLRRRHGLRR